jgi:hypothetical protein
LNSEVVSLCLFGRGAQILIQYPHGGAAGMEACHCRVTTVQK